MWQYNVVVSDVVIPDVVIAEVYCKGELSLKKK